MWKIVWVHTNGSTGPEHVSGKSQTLEFCWELVPLVLYVFCLISPCFVFIMVSTRQFKDGSRSGSGADGQDGPTLIDDHVREIMCEEVVSFIRGRILELVEFFKVAMMEYIYDRYATLSEVVVAATSATVAAVGAQGEKDFQYLDFDRTKPPKFDGVLDPIVAMRWLSDVEGCFFTCSCLDD